MKIAIDQSRMNRQGITSESIVNFTDTVPIQKPGEPAICRLSHILDIAPMNVSDVSPMSLVVEVSLNGSNGNSLYNINNFFKRLFEKW
jgi:hypothetical protein